MQLCTMSLDLLSSPLGRLLIKSGLIVEEQLDRALALQNRGIRHLGEILIDMGLITERSVVETLRIAG